MTRLEPTASKKAVYLRMFAAGLYLLIESHLDDLDRIFIDTEYPAREADTRGMLLVLIRRIQADFPSERIVFRQVGKKSPAHHLAWEVYTGKQRAHRVVTEEELLELF